MACASRPEIERYHRGVVIPAMVGHMIRVLGADKRLITEGVVDWAAGTVNGLLVRDGWYLVHHPERCGPNMELDCHRKE